jgi:hypothetical protein
MSEEDIKTTLQVPRPLWKIIKNMAFDKHVSTNDLVVEALQKVYGKVKE